VKAYDKAIRLQQHSHAERKEKIDKIKKDGPPKSFDKETKPMRLRDSPSIFLAMNKRFSNRNHGAN
jgi:hypothetical protein